MNRIKGMAVARNPNHGARSNQLRQWVFAIKTAVKSRESFLDSSARQASYSKGAFAASSVIKLLFLGAAAVGSVFTLGAAVTKLKDFFTSEDVVDPEQYIRSPESLDLNLPEQTPTEDSALGVPQASQDKGKDEAGIFARLYDSIAGKIREAVKDRNKPEEKQKEQEDEEVPKKVQKVPKLLNLKNPKDRSKAEIYKAAVKFGIDPSLLLGISEKETGGSFDPRQRAVVAKGIVNTATGLFQFTDATWYDYVKKYGKKYNITIKDRYNTRAQAIMGALYVKESIELVEGMNIPQEKAVYAVHVLGKGGARYFFSKLKENPKANAPKLYEQEGRANVPRGNPGLFYNDGSKRTQPRTLQEVLDKGFGSVAKRIEKYKVFDEYSKNEKTPLEIKKPEVLGNLESIRQPSYSSVSSPVILEGSASAESTTSSVKVSSVMPQSVDSQDNKPVVLSVKSIKPPAKEIRTISNLPSVAEVSKVTANPFVLDMPQDYYRNSNNRTLVQG